MSGVVFTDVSVEPKLRDTWDEFVASAMFLPSDPACDRDEHVMYVSDVERMVEEFFGGERSNPDATEFEELSCRWVSNASPRSEYNEVRWLCKACGEGWTDNSTVPPDYCPNCGRRVENREEFY